MTKETTADIILPEDERNPNEDLDALDEASKQEDKKEENASENTDKSKDGETDSPAVPASDKDTPPSSKDETPPESSDSKETERDSDGYLIPKYRYDNAKQRAEDAERRLQELEARLKDSSLKDKEPVDDKTQGYEQQLADIDAKHAKAIADADYELAAKLQNEARQVERRMYREEMEYASAARSAQTLEQIRLDQTIESLNRTYPALDVDSDSFNQNLVDDVVRLQTAFVASGMSPSNALLEAVKYMRLEDTLAPKKEETPPEQRKTDVQRNVDTANKQPPTLDKAGNDSDTGGLKEKLPDVNQLSDEEFDALPESTKKRMRGDFV